MYALWVQQDDEAWDHRFSSSSDGGRTWLEPKTLSRLENPQDIISHSGSYAGQMLATMQNIKVTQEGVILSSWYVFHGGANRGNIVHRRVASASVDGGRTS